MSHGNGSKRINEYRRAVLRLSVVIRCPVSQPSASPVADQQADRRFVVLQPVLRPPVRCSPARDRWPGHSPRLYCLFSSFHGTPASAAAASGR